MSFFPRSLLVGVLVSIGAATAVAQKAFPPAALNAKTVAILNDTHAQAVTDGAVAELGGWGHLKVIDDPASADIVMHFTKETRHDRTNTETKDDKDNTSSYGVSFSSSSSVLLSVTTKDGFAPFYTTQTKDAKQKAGHTCVQSFIGAYQDAYRMQK